MAGHKRRRYFGPWVRLQSDYYLSPKVKDLGIIGEALFVRIIASCSRVGKNGRLHVEKVHETCRNVRGWRQHLYNMVLVGLLELDANTGEYVIRSWAKYNPRLAISAAHDELYDDDDPYDQQPLTRGCAREPAQTRPSAPARGNDTIRVTDLLKEQSRSVTKTRDALSPAPPQCGGAAAPTRALEARVLPPAEVNPKLKGIDGADEAVPDWRDLPPDRKAADERPVHIAEMFHQLRARLNASEGRRHPPPHIVEQNGSQIDGDDEK